MENVKSQEGLWRLDCLGKNKSPQKLGTFILMVEQRSVCASQCSSDSFLVEMVVIETTSENLFLKLSTSVVYLLDFPT